MILAVPIDGSASGAELFVGTKDGENVGLAVRLKVGFADGVVA